ncbi:hypothetical protein CW751_11720 [Brumimicrobium salinarum]|uniref:Esterase n=1 Tax=Brumimicrobium salinarum TaxID=2058658 RepID=A0A2I0R0W1_9FLAO|nr:alpha/beta hydrolase-fold protein [Brumimicrobium salinarum]PKR80030.1 hypothetical protein CW751_11720 [Brumimicrobium salinarum]
MILSKMYGTRLLLLSLILLMSQANANSQELSIDSKILNQTRGYKIYKPTGIINQSSPIIYTLDGLGAMTYGINQVNAKFGRSINAIVIEIESDDRWKDFATNPNGSFGKNSDLTRRFLVEEFFPMIDSIYPKSSYRVAVGHSLTALFWNNLITKNPEYVDALVSISPMATDSTLVNINSAYKKINKDLRLYFSYAKDDLSGHEKSFKSIPKRDKLSKISYKIERIKNTTHTTVIPQSVQNGLIHVFYELQELDRYSIRKAKKLFKSIKGESGFLENYYSNIEKVYGIKLNYRRSDIIRAPIFIERWGDLEDIIPYCNEHLNIDSEIWQLYFYKGLYYEEKKNYRKALLNYERGYKLMVDEDAIFDFSPYKEDIIRVKGKL